MKGDKVSVSTSESPRRLVYFAVNKPRGFVCSNLDAKGNGKRCVDILQPWLDGWMRKSTDKVRQTLHGSGLVQHKQIYDAQDCPAMCIEPYA